MKKKQIKNLKKVEILMNWQCNQRCIFCSVGHKLVHDGQSKDWKEIKKDIDFAKKSNAGVLSFSGGEPTIRKELPKAIKYADSLGFEKIEIQSNGRMLKYKDYVKELKEAGLTTVLVSIHAPNAKLEDFLTQVKGSFKEKVEGMKHLEKFGIEKRTSTVITRYNYKELPETAKLLLKFKKNTKSYHFNFAIPDGFAKQNFEEMVPRIGEAMPYLRKACSLLLKGEGNPFLHNIYPCLLPEYTQRISELTITDTTLIGPSFRADIQANRFKYREKGPECKKCQYYLLCVGPFKEYVKKRGFEEFKPLEGQYLKKDKFRLREY